MGQWSSGRSSVCPSGWNCPYTVTGTDANGCEGADSVLVTVNELPFVEGLVTDATCGLPNGSVEAINASGGSSPYSYSFAGGVRIGNTV